MFVLIQVLVTEPQRRQESSRLGHVFSDILGIIGFCTSVIWIDTSVDQCLPEIGIVGGHGLAGCVPPDVDERFRLELDKLRASS
jgi:hypothetical protein